MFRFVKALAFVVAAGVAAYMLYDGLYGPQAEVIGHGKVYARSHYSDKRAERPTRQVRRGILSYWEVQMPGGTWQLAGRVDEGSSATWHIVWPIRAVTLTVCALALSFGRGQL